MTKVLRRLLSGFLSLVIAFGALIIPVSPAFASTPASNAIATGSTTSFNGQLYRNYRGLDGKLYFQALADGLNWSTPAEYGGVTSDVAPTIAAFGSNLYEAIKDGTAIKVRSSANGTTWGSFTTLSGTTAIADSPTLVTYGSKLYLAYRGTDNKIYTRSTTNGTTWGSDYGSASGLTTAPVGMVDWNGSLLQAIRGTDNLMYFRTAADGVNFSAWSGFTSASASVGPAVGYSSTLGRYFWLTKGTDGNTYASVLNSSWSAWKLIDVLKSASGISLTVANGSVYLTTQSTTGIKTYTSTDGDNWVETVPGVSTDSTALFGSAVYRSYRGLDNRIYVQSSTDGLNWSTAAQYGGLSYSAPALETYDSNLYQVVRGVDNVPYVRSSANGTTWSSFTSLGGLTIDAPALATYGSNLYLAIRGTDSKVYTKSFNGSTWGSYDAGAGSTPSAPAMIAGNGALIQYVRGGDNKLYIRTASTGTNWGAFSNQGDNTSLTVDAIGFTANSAPGYFRAVKGGDGVTYASKLPWSGGAWSAWSAFPQFNSISGLSALIFNGNYLLTYQEVGGGVRSIGSPDLVTWNSAPTIGTVDPGSKGSDISNAVKLGTSVYFLANDGQSGLWKTDGTTGGTTLVKAFSPGGADLVAMASTLYFTATDATNGTELWKSDGTTVGTVMVANVAPGSASGNPQGLTVYGSNLIFSADDGTGRELWQSNGSTVSLAANINTTANKGSAPYGFAVFNSKVYFGATTDNQGTELWQWNGTSATIIADQVVGTGSLNPRYLTATPNFLFYSGALGGQDANGLDQNVEMLRIATSGTVTASDYNTTTATASSFPAELMAAGSDLFFSADNGTDGRELWAYNATANTISMVANIASGSTSSNPSYLTSIASGEVYFSAAGSSGVEPYRYTLGTNTLTLLSDIKSGGDSNPSYLKGIAGKVYFTADNGTNGHELYQFTPPSTLTLVKDINAPSGVSPNPPSLPYLFTDLGSGKVVFAAYTNNDGYEPHVTDGTGAGTFQLKNINTALRTAPIEFAMLPNGTMVFSGTDKDYGTELWAKTASGSAQRLVDIQAGIGSSNPSKFTVIGSTVYFSASRSSDGTQLWKTDGTAGGTSLVSTAINGANGGAGISNLAAMGGNLYFTGATGTNFDELGLYKWTGSTRTVIKSFGNDGYFNEPVAAGSTLYFTAGENLSQSSTAGVELWKTDGSTATQVANINTTTGGSSSPYELVPVGNTLYFAADNGSSGYELWKTDGTTTSLVLDVQAGADGSNLTQLTAVGNYLTFFAYTNRERYSYDGSTTYVVNNAGSSSTTSDRKLTLWRTDGTNTDQVFSYLEVNNVGYNQPSGTTSYTDYPEMVTGSGLVFVPWAKQSQTVYTTPRGRCSGLTTDSPPTSTYTYRTISTLGIDFGNQPKVNLPPSVYGVEGYDYSNTLWSYGVTTTTRPTELSSFHSDYECINTLAYPFLHGVEVRPDPRLNDFKEVSLAVNSDRLFIAGFKQDSSGNPTSVDLLSMTLADANRYFYQSNGYMATRPMRSIATLPGLSKSTLTLEKAGDTVFAKYQNAAGQWQMIQLS
jgi:ELWxxDGT repeat protein